MAYEESSIALARALVQICERQGNEYAAASVRQALALLEDGNGRASVCGGCGAAVPPPFLIVPMHMTRGGDVCARGGQRVDGDGERA